MPARPHTTRAAAACCALHFSAPANANVWIKNLVKSEVQGCGHIRLMLANDTAPLYSVQLSGPNVTNCAGVASNDCISSASVAAAVIEQFYRCVRARAPWCVAVGTRLANDAASTQRACSSCMLLPACCCLYVCLCARLACCSSQRLMMRALAPCCNCARSWWFSAPGSAVRRRVNFAIDLGPLIGKAVTVVSMSNGARHGMA